MNNEYQNNKLFKHRITNEWPKPGSKHSLLLFFNTIKHPLSTH